MKNDTPITLQEPWFLTEKDLTKQLQLEISNKHVLFSKPLKTIAQRQDRDDVLFELADDEYKYAVVHLTWSKNIHEDGKYPLTTLYKDWKNLYENRIKPDVEGFEK